jgi:hypothetical protein
VLDCLGFSFLARLGHTAQPRSGCVRVCFPFGPVFLPLKQLRQLGEVRRHAAGLVLGEQLRRRATPQFLLEIEIPERLPGGVPHDEARIVVLLDRPRRREAAGGGRQIRAMISAERTSGHARVRTRPSTTDAAAPAAWRSSPRAAALHSAYSIRSGDAAPSRLE